MERCYEEYEEDEEEEEIEISFDNIYYERQRCSI